MAWLRSPESVCENVYPGTREGVILVVALPRSNRPRREGQHGDALTGRCLCGEVAFAIEAPLISAVYCHCTRCQRRTGTAASASALMAAGSLRVIAGEDLVRAYMPEDGNEKLFCSVCGSGLFSRSPDAPDQMAVRLGALDRDPGVRPGLRQFVADAAPWESIPDDGLPRYPGRRPG